MTKTKIAIIYGGKSAEHEISIRSAKNVVQNINTDIYSYVLIKISKKGEWLTDKNMVLNNSFAKIDDLANFEPEDSLYFNPRQGNQFIIAGIDNHGVSVDAVFPVLHGPNGEDGTIQGLLKILGLPFVGPGVLGSAVGMDKEIMKRIFKEANIKIGDYLVAKNNNYPSFEKVKSKLGLPVYVKPANMGSSVGISKVSIEQEYVEAISLAFQFDRKLVIEANIEGREIECAVLGNENPQASQPGEIIAAQDFYDYKSKYLNDNASELVVNAILPEHTTKELQSIAIKAFKSLECEGMSRVDFFVTKDNEVIINEINTIPGFTSISMYPKLWLESGVSYRELISKLIELAFERFEKEQKLKTSI